MSNRMDLKGWSERRPRAWRRGRVLPIWQGSNRTRPLHRRHIKCFGSLECTSLSGLASRTYAADMASYESHLSLQRPFHNKVQRVGEPQVTTSHR